MILRMFSPEKALCAGRRIAPRTVADKASLKTAPPPRRSVAALFRAPAWEVSDELSGLSGRTQRGRPRLAQSSLNENSLPVSGAIA